ncbi:terminal nucleotidyltransferase 4A-like [Callorhinchus milii]|uniref:terminal nucleotidyltransferase 4A-like n=1 Tax=Callorhinchus milii TaxID=7868 RepID=UPI001C3F670D|nr:terminal nucleotidyltransferase 4A-like [Callorhinchus milii]
MDPRVAWIQPEQKGPANALWMQIWETSQGVRSAARHQQHLLCGNSPALDAKAVAAAAAAAEQVGISSSSSSSTAPAGGRTACPGQLPVGPVGGSGDARRGLHKSLSTTSSSSSSSSSSSPSPEWFQSLRRRERRSLLAEVRRPQSEEPGAGGQEEEGEQGQHLRD